MSEEHRYHRSGKKCREKFENLHKYYKKAREGRGGRQDGRNYRFFRQLEAIRGNGTGCYNHPRYDRPIPQLDLADVYRVPSTFEVNVGSEDGAGTSRCSPSFSNSMSVESVRLDTLEEDEEENDVGEGELSAIALMMASESEKMRRAGGEGRASKMSASSGSGGKRRKGWKEKVEAFVDEQVRRLVEKQEEWMDKTMREMESSERERVRRETEWGERESARFERERELWERERAWMEARDAAFVYAVNKSSGMEPGDNCPGNEPEEDLDEGGSGRRWQEGETLSLIQVVTGMEPRRRPGTDEAGFWGLIEAKMASVGHERSAAECRSKWRTQHYVA